MSQALKREKFIKEYVTEFVKLLNSTLEAKKKSVYNLMLDRFKAERSTYDGSTWDSLSKRYVKYHRKIKDAPILVQDGNLKSSIKVHVNLDANSDESFFYAEGNVNAVRNNDKRVCLEIPKEYAKDGFLEIKMIDRFLNEITDKGVNIYNNITTKRL